MTTQTSLFDRLGGSPAMTAASELFYRKVLADPVLSPYFDDVDMNRQRREAGTAGHQENVTP
jgi:hemoglobin